MSFFPLATASAKERKKHRVSTMMAAFFQDPSTTQPQGAPLEAPEPLLIACMRLCPGYSQTCTAVPSSPLSAQLCVCALREAPR